jgi:hypothetical protein
VRIGAALDPVEGVVSEQYEFTSVSRLAIFKGTPTSPADSAKL